MHPSHDKDGDALLTHIEITEPIVILDGRFRRHGFAIKAERLRERMRRLATKLPIAYRRQNGGGKRSAAFNSAPN